MTQPSISQQIKTCTKCDLHKTRTNAVPGMGPANADILFIGEAPGAKEDELGLPFVGRSGQLLQDALQSIGFSREQVFITNSVKCRPPDNRDPTPFEKKTCSPFLKAQLKAIQPLMIVTLGRISMGEFLPDAKISQDRGTLHQITLPDHLIYPDAPLVTIYPVYHPSFALRGTRNLEAFLADFQKIPHLLNELRVHHARNRTPYIGGRDDPQ